MTRYTYSISGTRIQVCSAHWSIWLGTTQLGRTLTPLTTPFPAATRTTEISMNPIANTLKSVLYFICDGCRAQIKMLHPRVHCLVCLDYDSCMSCQTTSNFSAPHLGTHPTRTMTWFDASELPPTPSAAEQQTPAALSSSHPQPQPSNTVADETITREQQLHFHRQREQEAQNRRQQSFLDAQQIEETQKLIRAKAFAYNCILEGTMNVSGGWRTDSNGRRYYQEGFIR